MSQSGFIERLQQVAEEIRAAFEGVDAARERALPLSREIVRGSAEAIKCVHRAQFEEAQQRLVETRRRVVELLDTVKEFDALKGAGFVVDGCKEYVEAALTYALVNGHPLPSVQEVGVDAASYINGLAEALGELRRYVLDSIRQGKVEESERTLNLMDEVYYTMVSFDYPEAVTQGLRRRTDAARGIIERTRGDLTTALRQHELAQAMQELERKLNAQ